MKNIIIYNIILFIFTASHSTARDMSSFDIFGVKLDSDINSSLNLIKNQMDHIKFDETNIQLSKGMYKTDDILVGYKGSYSFGEVGAHSPTTQDCSFLLDLEENTKIVGINQRTFFHKMSDKPIVADLADKLKSKYGNPDYLYIDNMSSIKRWTYLVWSQNSKTTINNANQMKFFQNLQVFASTAATGQLYTGGWYNVQKEISGVGIYMICEINHVTDQTYNHLADNLTCDLVNETKINNSFKFINDSLNKSDKNKSENDTKSRKDINIKL